jgi:hypothetical protein
VALLFFLVVGSGFVVDRDWDAWEEREERRGGRGGTEKKKTTDARYFCILILVQYHTGSTQ